MPVKQRITIIGQQGSSVAYSLLQNPDFRVRCITRDAQSEVARAFQSLGAEVLEADAGVFEGMKIALHETWGLFVNLPTEFFPDAVAIALGTNIIRAAEAVGVKHVVFSSAPHASKLTNGRVCFNSLDVKAEIEEIAQASPLFKTFTPVMVGWYLENIGETFADLYGGFPVRKDAEGITECRLPLWGGNEEMPWISVKDDFGDLVHGVFLNPLRWNRRVIQCQAELMSAGDMTTTFSAVTGQKTRYAPCIDMADLKPGMFEGIQKMFQYTQLREGEYYPNGPSEVQTAAHLKRVAARAKKGHARETLLTVREYFEREWTSH
ncbi:NmrA-like family domain-containing oxidoreductase himF [Penicillium oxalicum]|uniref:NmrA-like family domain-containing oxidoreductase himF n=1 Tax=Penicillium oxalicum TaxID=69781 RepID=UPI0020B6F031|nr:NmrA-like family domain-containing oxidoreductase himF [Penicillium oxalicum]KAI2791381.1 NmrA-like family domain-containing oxidoreductase himF [Penicillium oxalicum]